MSLPSVSVQSKTPSSESQRITLEYKGMCQGILVVSREPNPYVNDTRSPTLYRINYSESDEWLQKRLAVAVVAFLNGTTPRIRRLATGNTARVTVESIEQHLIDGPLFVVDPKKYENVRVRYIPHGAGYPYADRRPCSYLHCDPPLGVVGSIC
jgi:hypothetical protein